MLGLARGDLLIAPDSFAQFIAAVPGAAVSELAYRPYRAPVYFMFSRRTVDPRQLGVFDAALAAVLSQVQRQ